MLEERERRLELRLGLAAEADDDVGRDRDPRDGLADPGEPLEVVLDRVLAAHPAEDRVVARLDGQVEVLADRRAVGHRGDQPVRQVPRVRGDEAQASDRPAAIGGPQRIDRADQLGQVRAPGEVEPVAGPPLGVHVGEPLLGRQVVAVGVDVLAEQRHLAIAGGAEGARLVDDLVERTAALRTAAERDDAVGAGLVAAVDDRQPGRDRRAAGHGPGGDRRGAGAGQVVGDTDDGPPDGRGGADRASADRAPAPTPARAGRPARAPRPGAGTGPPPGSGAAARPGRARGPSSRSARPAWRGSRS